MARQGGVKAYNNFVKGIITEANALTFPENASLDEANCILNTDGSRQRRLGMDVIAGSSAVGLAVSTSAEYSTFRWDNVEGAADLAIGLIQLGDYLYAFDLRDNTRLPLHPSTDYRYLGGGVGATKWQYAAINGSVIITTGGFGPLLLSRDPVTETFSITYFSIRIRDFIGLDGEEVATRPATLTDEHHYNLLNQGWSDTNITAYQAYVGGDSVYPSSTQSWYTGKDADDLFDPELLDKFDFGNTPAAKGHYVVAAMSRGSSRATQSGIGSVADDNELGNITTVATHAGRVFYSGVDSQVENPNAFSPNYNGWVFFSRTLENNSQVGQCYQDGDPTTEFVGDVVASDGGYVTIPEAGHILKMISLQSALLIIATNGVWQLSGADGGFLATEYQLSKITAEGATGDGSVTVVEDSVFYWAAGGIYLIQLDNSSGLYVATNLTASTIQTLYAGIPDASKAYATGVYDAATKKLSWLYINAYAGITQHYRYDTELTLNVTTGSFSKNTISPVDATYVVGAFIGNTPAPSGSYVHYLAITDNIINSDIALAYYHDATFHDWKSVDGVGVDAAAYVLTGHELYDSLTQIKQVPYFFGYFKRTETGFDETTGELVNPSSCMVQGQWAWTDDVSSNRWTAPFQAYRLKGIHMPSSLTDVQPFETIVTKSKMRGKGEALSILMSSEEGKDFHILGWATSVSMLGAP